MSSDDPCNSDPHHPQRTVTVRYGAEHCGYVTKTLDVDEGIADLLVLLHARNILTRYSCQGYPERKRRAYRNAYIMFDGVDYAARFAAFLKPDTLPFEYANGILDMHPKTGRIIENKESWVWELNTCPHPFEEWTKDDPQYTDMSLNACVRFPPEHIPLIVAALQPVGYSPPRR